MSKSKNNVLTHFQKQQVALLLALFPVVTVVIQRTPGISVISIIFYIYFGFITLAQVMLQGVKNIKVSKPQWYFYLFALQVSVYYFFYRTVYLADFVPLLLFFTTAITFSLIITKKNIQYVIAGIIFTYFVVLFFSLVEFLLGIYLFEPATYFVTQSAFKFFHVPVVTFHNTNNLASFLLLGTPFIVARFKKNKVLLSSILMLSYLMIMACQSTIGMAVYPLYFAYLRGWHKKIRYFFRQEKTKAVNLNQKIFIVTIFTAIFTALYPYLMKIPMIYVRVNVFLLYFTVGITHVVLGSGFGASIRLAAHNWMHLPPHNFFLFVMYDYGILGLFLICAALYLGLKQIYSVHFHANKYVHAIFEMVLLFVVIVHIIPSGIYTESMMWIMFGLLLATTSPSFLSEIKVEKQIEPMESHKEIVGEVPVSVPVIRQRSKTAHVESELRRSRKTKNRMKKRRME